MLAERNPDGLVETFSTSFLSDSLMALGNCWKNHQGSAAVGERETQPNLLTALGVEIPEHKSVQGWSADRAFTQYLPYW